MNAKTRKIYGGLFMVSGFGGLAIMTVGAGLQESQVTLAGFVLVAVAIVAALDSIRRNGIADMEGKEVNHD